MSFQRVCGGTIELPVAGVIEVDGISIQQVPSGAKPWGYRVVIDGEVVFDTGYHNDVTGLIPVGGIKGCDAGARSYELQAALDPTIYVTFAFLKAKGFNNAQG